MGEKALAGEAKAPAPQRGDIGSKFSTKMRQSANDSGKVDTMRHTILSLIAAELYERAIEGLKEHLESKHEYPMFKERSSRYIEYSIDLINAIKAKRSFPGLQNLAMAKQQELFDRSMVHFEDLKITLKKIEQIDCEVRIEDVRSTVLVIKVCVYCLFAILALAFFMEVSRGLLPSMLLVADKYFSVFVEWGFDKLGI
jgi:hypothetical protein